MSDKVLGLLVISALAAALMTALGVLILYRLDAVLLALAGG